MSFLNDVFKTSVGLATHPFSSDAAKDQQVALRSGIGTGQATGQTGLLSTDQPVQKNESASDTMARLQRAEWDDYKARFEPYNQKLIGLATGDEDNQQAVAMARSSAGLSFANAQRAADQDRERYGTALNADELQANTRGLSHAKAVADVGAVNQARLAASDRDMDIMSGDMSSGLKTVTGNTR